MNNTRFSIVAMGLPVRNGGKKEKKMLKYTYKCKIYEIYNSAVAPLPASESVRVDDITLDLFRGFAFSIVEIVSSAVPIELCRTLIRTAIKI